MYGKCTRSDAGTSSQLGTVSGSNMKISLANSTALKVCVCVQVSFQEGRSKRELLKIAKRREQGINDRL